MGIDHHFSSLHLLHHSTEHLQVQPGPYYRGGSYFKFWARSQLALSHTIDQKTPHKNWSVPDFFSVFQGILWSNCIVRMRWRTISSEIRQKWVCWSWAAPGFAARQFQSRLSVSMIHHWIKNFSRQLYLSLHIGYQSYECDFWQRKLICRAFCGRQAPSGLLPGCDGRRHRVVSRQWSWTSSYAYAAYGLLRISCLCEGEPRWRLFLRFTGLGCSCPGIDSLSCYSWLSCTNPPTCFYVCHSKQR